jgi:hypothetical protein
LLAKLEGDHGLFAERALIGKVNLFAGKVIKEIKDFSIWEDVLIGLFEDAPLANRHQLKNRIFQLIYLKLIKEQAYSMNKKRNDFF